MSSPKRDFAIAFSLANLAFIPTWLELLFRSADAGYYMKRLPAPGDYVAAIFAVCLLGGAFFAVARLASRSPALRVVWGVLFAAALIIPLNTLRLKLPRETGVGRILASGPGLLALIAFVVLAFAFAIYRFRTRVFPGVTGAVAILAPFAALTVLRASWGAVSPPPAFEAKPSLSVATSTSSALVVWMIFDELDYRLAFDERPKDLKLPEFDRFRDESLFAINAFPPSNATLKSIPSLLTGRVVEDADVSGPHELLLTIKGEAEKLPWSKQENVFSRARSIGAETGVVGWYHPYCRILGASLTHCAWWPVYQTSVGRADASSFFGSVSDDFAAILPTNGRRLHIASYEQIIGDAVNALRVQKRGVLFLHLPVPHSPSIYDRGRGDFSIMEWSNVRGYVDNMALADRALGELRRAMDWDAATVIASADHPWRQSKAYDGKKDPRVPFLVKLPGQKTRVDFGDPVQTVITQKLVLELLEDHISSLEALKSWLATTSP